MRQFILMVGQCNLPTTSVATSTLQWLFSAALTGGKRQWGRN